MFFLDMVPLESASTGLDLYRLFSDAYSFPFASKYSHLKFIVHEVQHIDSMIVE
jgi:hypothetical protein